MTFGIESANIVGYTQKEAAQGKFIILGAQFEQVTGVMNVNGLISGVTPVEYDEEGAFQKTAPQIQIPNGVGYTTCYYIDGAWDVKNQKEVIGWADATGDLAADAVITPGEAIWCKSVGANAEVLVAGAVAEDDVSSIDCPATFALRANVFPIAFDVNSKVMSSDNITPAKYDEEGNFQKTAPQIQIPNGVGYTTYYYIEGAWDVTNQKEVTGWADATGDLISAQIDVAQGFWTKGVNGSFTLKFVK